MCCLAHTNPGKMWDVRKSSVYATVEATAWAGCVWAVGTLYAHSSPPAKGSLRDSKITEYTLPPKPRVPQGATPPLVKCSVVVQTPSPREILAYLLVIELADSYNCELIVLLYFLPCGSTWAPQQQIFTVPSSL